MPSRMFRNSLVSNPRERMLTREPIDIRTCLQGLDRCGLRARVRLLLGDTFPSTGSCVLAAHEHKKSWARFGALDQTMRAPRYDRRVVDKPTQCGIELQNSPEQHQRCVESI